MKKNNNNNNNNLSLISLIYWCTHWCLITTEQSCQSKSILHSSCALYLRKANPSHQSGGQTTGCHKAGVAAVCSCLHRAWEEDESPPCPPLLLPHQLKVTQPKPRISDLEPALQVPHHYALFGHSPLNYIVLFCIFTVGVMWYMERTSVESVTGLIPLSQCVTSALFISLALSRENNSACVSWGKTNCVPAYLLWDLITDSEKSFPLAGKQEECEISVWNINWSIRDWKK